MRILTILAAFIYKGLLFSDTAVGGESNAKMHLVLTPDVFALRLNAAIFDCFAVENRKFRASKKPTVGFFEQGLRQ